MLKSLFLRVFRPDRMPVIAAGDDPVRFEALSRAYWDDRTQKINEIIRNGDSLSPQDQQDRLRRTIESLKAEYRANKTRTDIDDTTRQQAENELVKLQLSVARSAKMLNTTHPALDRVKVEQMADVYWGNRRRELKHSVLGANLAPQDKQELLRRTLHSLRNEQMSHNANPQLDPLVRSRTDSELTDLMILTTQEIRKTMQSIDAAVAPAPVVKERYWTAERVADYLEPIARAAREARRLAEEKIDDFKIWLPPVMEKISRRVEDTRSHVTHMAQKARDHKASWVMPRQAVALGSVGASLASVFALVSALNGPEPVVTPAPDISMASGTAAPTSTPAPVQIAKVDVTPRRNSIPVAPAHSAPIAVAKAPQPLKQNADVASVDPYPSQSPQQPTYADPASNEQYQFDKKGQIYVMRPRDVSRWNVERMFHPENRAALEKAIASYEALPVHAADKFLSRQESGGQQFVRDKRTGQIIYDTVKNDKGEYVEIPRVLTSNQGAIGERQLLISTAMRVADMIGLKTSVHHVKYDQNVNRKLGQAYHSYLWKMFNESNTKAALGYIMGEGGVQRLIGKYGDPGHDASKLVDLMTRIPHRGNMTQARHYLLHITSRIDPLSAAREFGEDVTGPWVPVRLSQAKQADFYKQHPELIDGRDYYQVASSVPSQPSLSISRRTAKYNGSGITNVSYQYNDNARNPVKYDVNATMLSAGPSLSSGTVLKAGPSYGRALSSGTEDRILEADGSNVLQSVSPN